ncbi:MAG: hypothetical protein ACI8V2_003687 [Candidatus Latescibacterota bacterium]
MQSKRPIPYVAYIVALLTLLLTFGQTHAEGKKYAFDKEGNLIRPEGYREWVYMGTPLTPNDMNPPEAAFPEFHNVYIHPEDFAHYKMTGNFQDGTIIVKELVLVGAKQAVSGNGYFMGDFVGLEATIKDAHHFKNEPGNWAYFSFGHSYPLAKTATAFPTASCNTCHAASAMDDFVFTQYYPVLRAAKGGQNGGRSMNAQAPEFQKIAASMEGALERGSKANAPAGKVDSEVPTNAEDLFKYLQKGSYKQFTAHESALHPSRGPHTKYGLPVQVYLNNRLDQSLSAGNKTHPAGSAVVKEMYDANSTLQGWAVMVKTQKDSDQGNGWFWYEVTSPTKGDKPVAAGNGVPMCFGCHATGQDYVLTNYPLK